MKKEFYTPLAIKKAKSRKTIRGYRIGGYRIRGYRIGGYRIRGYRPEFSITKNLTFLGQKKLAKIPEKIANMLAKTLKKIMPLKY